MGKMFVLIVCALAVHVPSCAGLQFMERTAKDASLQDVLEVSKSAEALGEIYAKAAGTLPSAKERSDMVMTENAMTLGALEQELASEKANPVDVGPCVACDQ